MKTLSLTQPWASLVAVGAKRIETRSWYTSHRGPLAIHAAKGFPPYARDFAEELMPFRALSRNGLAAGDLPLGAIVATCRLLRCIRTEEIGNISGQEREFGDYTHGRWAWVFEDVERLPEPIPVRGSLGLWDWDRPSVEVASGR